MTNEEAIKYLQQLYPNGGNCWFDEPCDKCFYIPTKRREDVLRGTNSNLASLFISTPTLQMAMKWLREEKNCPIEFLWHWDSDNQCEEWYFKHHVELREQPQVEYYDKYEKACESAIKYCLENLI